MHQYHHKTKQFRTLRDTKTLEFEINLPEGKKYNGVYKKCATEDFMGSKIEFYSKITTENQDPRHAVYLYSFIRVYIYCHLIQQFTILY